MDKRYYNLNFPFKNWNDKPKPTLKLPSVAKLPKQPEYPLLCSKPSDSSLNGKNEGKDKKSGLISNGNTIINGINRINDNIYGNNSQNHNLAINGNKNNGMNMINVGINGIDIINGKKIINAKHGNWCQYNVDFKKLIIFVLLKQL